MPRADHVPRYQRVINAIIADIEAGRLAPGDQLPSTKQLAEDHGFSPGTIRQAVDALIERGVLRGEQGVGVFVAGVSAGPQT